MPSGIGWRQLRRGSRRRMRSNRPGLLWMDNIAFTLLALVAPTLLAYAIYFQLNLATGSLDVPAGISLATTGAVIAVFWIFNGYLLIQRFQQEVVRLLFVHGQVLAVTMVYPLSQPMPWTEPAPVFGLSIAAFYFLAPLTLHLYITFPVTLGSRRRRCWLLSFVYLTALASLFAWLFGSTLLRQIGELYTIAIFSLSLAVLVYTYAFKAAPDSRRRLRIIWFGTLLALVPTNAFYFVPGLYGMPTRMPVWLVGLLLVMMPLSYLYVITRQNLFGLDRLLNRTLVYLLLTAFILAAYLVLLVFVYRALSIGWLWQALLSAGITLLIGWNFTWLRIRIERAVDRFFYGGWYDYPEVVDSVSAALAGSLEREQVIEVLTRQVPRLMWLHPGSLSFGDSPAGNTLSLQQPYLEFHFQLKGGLKASWHVAGHQDGEDFSANDRRILKTLAQQAEIALNNVVLVETLRAQLAEIRSSRATLSLIQRQLLRSREEERSHLARELHDGPLQTLIGMNLQLGALQNSLSSQDSQALTDLRAEVLQLLNDLRAVCSELRPPMLDTLGLGAALRVLAAEWSQQHGIAIQLNLPQDIDLRSLPEEAAVTLYRVAQEALSNIARHSQAEKAMLSFRKQGDAYELNIQDNGRGFMMPESLQDLAADDHYGLVGMRERVELLGGSLLIRSQPGNGTLVQVCL
jgi:signal transduction histidine kinase